MGSAVPAHPWAPRHLGILPRKIYNAFLLEKVKNKLFPDRSSSELQIIEDAPSAPPPSIGAQFQEYIELCEAQGISLGVIYDKNRLLKLFRSYKIQALEHISQDFINKIVHRHLPSMANKLVKNLKSFLNFCIKRQYYERSRYESLTFLMSKDKVRETVISQKDYEKLISHCKDKDMRLYMQTLWQLMVQPSCTVERCTVGETGCRPNEIIELSKTDIDFEKGIAKIYQSKTKRDKIVYFTDGLLKEFKKAPSDEPFFTGQDRNKDYYTHKFRKLKEKLGLNPMPSWAETDLLCGAEASLVLCFEETHKKRHLWKSLERFPTKGEKPIGACLP